MTDTLFDVLAGVARELPGSWYEGIADAGASDALSFADKDIGGTDDTWNRGTALVLRTAAGAAPQGQTRIINDYDAKGGALGDGLVILETAFSAVVTAGDTIALWKPRYRRSQIIGRINQALLDITLPYENATDTVSVATDNVYTLPTNFDPQNLLQVWVAVDIDNTAWVPIYHWAPYTDAAGVHKIRFDDYFTSDMAIKFIRGGYHAKLAADADTIDSRIDLNMLTWMSIVRVLRWRYNKYTSPPEQITNALNAALREEARLKGKHMPFLPGRQIRLPSSLSGMGGGRPSYPVT
jgi:hypothetical protein